MAYVLLDEFKDYIRDQVSVDDAVSQAALTAAEVMINDFCQRSFDVAGASSTRSYTPPSGECAVLRIHDCTSITSITEWGSTLAAASYQAEPVGLLTWTGAARPYEQVRRYGAPWAYDYGKAQIVVTATWGWSATPASVTEATKIIAKDILQQRNNNSGVAGFGEFGAIRVRMNPIAIDLLKPLRRGEAFGVA